MGRQAKLKQQRRQASENPKDSAAPPAHFDQTQFVQQLEHQGYQLQKTQQAPELPNNNSAAPQL